MQTDNKDFNFTVTELFELQANKNPYILALKDISTELTYSTLDKVTNQLARILKLKSVQQGDFVAILLDPCVDFFICILAIIKLGATYVPLDTHAPKARINEILNDSNPKAIITCKEYFSSLKSTKTATYLFKQLQLESKNLSNKNIKSKTLPTSPLYMIYTSGSTGKPKGVVVRHRAVVNLAVIDNITATQKGEHVGQFCNLAFDGSVFETWNALLNGAVLYIIHEKARKNHNYLKQIINEFEIRYLLIPTGYFHQLLKSFPETLDFLHTISFGGEQVNVHLLKNFIEFRKTKNLPVKLINVYGPTEATVFSSCNVVYSKKIYNDEQLASIGFKTANTKTYVVDNQGHLAEEGELWVSGVHLAVNYHNSPSHTEEKFIQNPFSQDELFAKIYKTGDRVRYLSTRELLYLGRSDDQVKIGGFRIHLNEIERELMNHETISLASVAVEVGGGSHQFLTAYIVFDDTKENTLHTEEIRSFLAQKLPVYMLPSKYIKVEKLPLTLIGKVDKNKLRNITQTDLSFHIDSESESQIEETIKSIWKNLLNLSSIDSNKNLFDLGANSLLITEACYRINKELQCNLQMVDMLSQPTIHKLSEFLDGNLDKETIRKHNRSISKDIAIIGMSCRFPNAQNINEFWQALCEGNDCLTRFDDTSLPSSHLTDENFVPVKGVFDNANKFDADFFNFSPVDAKITDPQHRIFLECAWEALEHAAIAPGKMQSKVISLFSGMTDTTYLTENLEKSQWSCNETNAFQRRIATSMGMLSTQVSYRLNLKGRSVNLNTACSTGLVTIDHACQDLILGQSDIALAGASSIVFPEKQSYLYQSGNILSKDGKCRPFSSESNGTVFSNGVGIVVLKRLEDAINDKNTIYAVIKGCGVNNDGADKLGFTAPSLKGQTSCIQEALHQAQLNPEKISYLEAHGTGTSLGDAIEIKALNTVYRQYTDKINFCALGSVKANIGHTDVTAGIAGIIKTALCLFHKKIPPLIHFKIPNPHLSLSNSPFYVNTTLIDWNTPNNRYAGVSSFGVGGTNAHVILCNYDENEKTSLTPSSEREELVLLSAKTQPALQDSVNKMNCYIKTCGDISLKNLAFTLQTGRENFKWRQFSVGKKTLEILKNFENNIPKSYDGTIKPSLVFMFSGQGSQYTKMAMGLVETVPKFAHYLRLGAKLAQPLLQCDLLSLLSETDSTKLHETEYAQPALFIVEYALAKILMECGIVPDVLVGHSIGEYVAACLSGVFSFEDGIKLVCRRGLLMATAPKGAMLSLETTKEILEQYIRIADVDIALHNTTHHFVLSGSTEEILKLEEYLSKRNLSFQRLKVSHPFHSRHMAFLKESFLELFANIKLCAPKIPIISNATGDWLLESEATSPNYWYQHLRETVQFSASVKRILQNKNPLFIELGPGQSLCGFIKAINNKANAFFTIPDRRQLTSDLFQLLSTLGELWTRGVDINVKNLVETKDCKYIPLPTYPFQRHRYWVEPNKKSITNNLPTLYKPVWSYEQIKYNQPSHHKNFDYLIFNDDRGIGNKLINILIAQDIQPVVIEIGQEFKQLNQSLLQINPNEKSHYIKLISCLKSKLKHPVIFHAISCKKKSEGYLTTEQIETNLGYGLYSILYLTQALIAKLGTTSFIHLSVITMATQRIIGTENICPANATLIGATRVIPLEHPNISCELVDISVNEDMTYMLHDLVNRSVISQKNKEHQLIAYRNGYRWDISYLPVKVKHGSTRLVDNGVYLVTGGLGGIGLTLCITITRQVSNPTFILCSRTAVIDECEWVAIANDSEHPFYQKIVHLQRLKELGANIYWQQTNIGNYEETLHLITLCKTHFGIINGVIHAAGIASGGLLQLKKKEDAQKVILSKVNATYNLARTLKDFRLDFVMLMSSIAAITGEPGQFDYCAANSCLDAFANSCLFNTESLLSINWNTWCDVGMSVNTTRPEDINLFERGNTITPSQGQELFLKALSDGGSNFIVSNMSVEDYSKLQINTQALIEDDNQASRDTLDLRQDFKAPMGEIENHLAKLWQSNLHIANIGREDDFFDLGGHSLKALNLIQQINNSLQTRLSIQHLYQEPTIKKLASVIANNNEDIQAQIVIPLKNSNSNYYPFFICHPISGMIYCFKDLTADWNVPVPLYAIQDPSIVTGQLQFDSIISMAKAYLSAIKKVQPHGPYFLVGYSLGGTVMYEVAQLLQAQNEPIGLLALIESWCKFSPQQKSMDYTENSGLLNELQESKELLALAWKRMELLLNHVPTKANLDMVLFKAAELSQDYQVIEDALNGWAIYNTGQIVCHTINANHDTIIRKGCKFIVQKLIEYKDIFKWEREPSL